MKRKITKSLRFLLFFCLALLAGCGYFESIITGVEPTPSLLSGYIVDSLSLLGIDSAEIELHSHSGKLTTLSRNNGTFVFHDISAGSKILKIMVDGYRHEQFEISLGKSGNVTDTFRLVRTNYAPKIERSLYPNVKINAPLAVRFVWSVSDSNLADIRSVEKLKYRFSFGTQRIPPVVDTGTIEILLAVRDTTVTDRTAFFSTGPDSVFRNLLPGKMYYYSIVVTDLFGDSAIYGVDSFFTREAFSSVCPANMALVEVNEKAFCIDKREFSNQRYAVADSNFSIVDSITFFSIFTNTPVVFVDYESAEIACAFEGKRLCKISEWEAAVGGYENRTYPYGNIYDPMACNTNLSTESYTRAFNTTWADDTLTSCVTPEGVYDLSGNVAEWVDNDKYFPVKASIEGIDVPYRYNVGGDWASGVSSSIRSSIDTDLPPSPYETVRRVNVGFRCCKSIQ